LEDPVILDRSALKEVTHPFQQVQREDRRIYFSRNQYGHPKSFAKILGRVIITDFGFSVMGDGPHFGAIQAERFRAPEVILNAGWSYSTDIWTLGLLVGVVAGLPKQQYLRMNLDLGPSRNLVAIRRASQG
jgi:serine/threonine-protein kinase SRPK3